MNIESANLPSIAPSSGMVENVSAPLADGGVISESFSGTLVAQIELLSNIKAEDSLPLQISDQSFLQSVDASQSIAGLPVDTQNFAALLGNDLPSSYKTKDDVDHEAALAAVTDTLKYITLGTTDGEKAAEAEQNVKDVIAMTIPAQQDIKNAAVPTEQNGVEKTVPVEQSLSEGEGDATKQMLNDAQVQMDLDQSNDKSDKKQGEDEAQIATVTDNRGVEELVATIILPSVIPVEQGKPVNNLAASNAIKGDGLLSFVKPLTEHAKPNQITKVSDDVLQSESVSRKPDQSKQDFNLKYFRNAGQSEQAAQVEQRVLNDGEKTLSRIATDIIQPNKLGVDNKTDVPAITKPLSHPEWNKDMGERIVWMSSRAIPSAEIRLNPQHLGPISVRVDVTDDKAIVVFTAQHAAVRETLEASIPKLREMMGAQQLNLVDVSVSQGSASDQGRSQSQNFAQTSGRGQDAVDHTVDGVDDVEQEIESGRAIVSKGLLSLYA
jgi:flagellar hook-length control protein FliK